MMDVDSIHKALAHPFRREILAWLKAPNEVFAREEIEFRHGVPAGAIHARAALSQSTVSAHIAVLVAAGLVISRKVGQWTLLSRDEERIRAFAEHICTRL
jgi:ArsR family transcriptional regulator